MDFIQAKHFRVGRRSKISLIVLHDMEAARSLKTALHVAQWFASDASPVASSHYNIDAGSIVQSVKDEDTAFGAPGANDNGLQIELAGFAKDTREQWLADGELELAAHLVALKCLEHDIPAVFCDAAAIVAGGSGITTHAEVTKAMRTPGGHTDPGGNYPMAEFIAMVVAAIAASIAPETFEPTEL